jgi:alkylation response protein AidB-like acyl-CoA dehydrogenase
MAVQAGDLCATVEAFFDSEILPRHRDWLDHVARREAAPFLPALQAKARAAGLWNLGLTERMSNRDYAPLAEIMGRLPWASEVFNCQAPDVPNMIMLQAAATAEQQKRWLEPLLAGEIRSVFCMTEPDVASSDATNIAATAVIDGDDVVLNGKKWWATGLGDPRARVAIFMGRTPDASKDRHHQHSMVVVPLDAPGVEIARMLPVFGGHDEPHGHGEVHFNAVRVPRANLIGAPGMGFEIAQGRLGPGRIHHCMRCVGAAEAALELAVRRGQSRAAFGRPVIDLGGNRERVAEARILIDQVRLLVLHAAWKIDRVGSRAAMAEISAIKVAAPRMLQRVVDYAIQIHGATGLSGDTPLPGFFAQARTLRIADGPDEVHLAVIARFELAKHAESR